MQHPDLNYLIQREIQHDRIREARKERQLPAHGRISALRSATGTLLIAIGSRLAPSGERSPVSPAIGPRPALKH